MRLPIFTVLGLLAVLPLLAQPAAQRRHHRLLAKLSGNSTIQHLQARSTTGTQPPIYYHPLYPGATADQPSASRTRNTTATYAIITIDTTATADAIITYLQQTGLFEYIEPDAIGAASAVAMPEAVFPNDPGFNKQWALNNNGTFSPTAKINADINMPEAWSVQQGSETITVAILDTGIKTDHPQFQNRFWSNPDETPENGIDDDHNGYIDDTHGWNFTNDTHTLTDDAGHGTHVAGIIGANGNDAASYAGVDWNCRLMICKVLEQDNTGYYSWWAQAIHYAVDHGAKVINMSLGGDTRSQTLEDAVNYARDKNVLIVASMQNTNSNITYYPAGHGATLAVGATDPDDTRSTHLGGSGAGSNYGQHIDLVAPGNYIHGLSYGSNPNDAVILSGTSQAAPFVSGVAALLWAQQPHATVDEIEKRITASADDQVGTSTEDSPGWDQYYGYGRLNAFRALVNDVNATRPEEDDLSIYPNPATTQINMVLTLRDPSPYSIILYNAHGKLVAQEQLPETRIVNRIIALENIPAGLYLVRIDSRNKRWVQKLIIR